MDVGKFLLKFNLPLIAFLAYLIRILYFGANFADAPILGILGAVFCTIEFFKAKKIVTTENNFRQNVIKEIEKIKSDVSSVKMINSGNMFKKR
jgi:hypothetical protein